MSVSLPQHFLRFHIIMNSYFTIHKKTFKKRTNLTTSLHLRLTPPTLLRSVNTMQLHPLRCRRHRVHQPPSIRKPRILLRQRMLRHLKIKLSLTLNRPLQQLLTSIIRLITVRPKKSQDQNGRNILTQPIVQNVKYEHVEAKPTFLRSRRFHRAIFGLKILIEFHPVCDVIFVADP